mmetsp:Transcript_18939/g.30943  ORF Transcript_18939/g.30943 Transcript_18939/m.30943 type:complete len:248 (-) Transcript_18939:342-1085(-)
MARCQQRSFLLAILVLFALVSKSVGAIEEYKQQGWEEWNQESFQEPPRARSAKRNEIKKGGTFFGRLVFPIFSFGFGFGINKIFKRKSVKALKDRLANQKETIWHNIIAEKERQMKIKNQEIDELTYKYQEAEQYFQQISQLVYEATVQNELKQVQTDYQEFSEPDLDKDGYISRREFDAYLQQHYRQNPQIPLSEYPTFDDFEQNGDGLVSFNEWRVYLAHLEQQQALQAQLQEYYAAQAAQQQRR